MPKKALSFVDLPGNAPDLLLTIGQGVRKARLRRRWSQRVLAEKAGISTHVLQFIEAGKPGTSIGSVLVVLWALRLTAPITLIGLPSTDVEGQALEAVASRRRARHSESSDDLDTDF